jgi:subtilase-type serine protease
VTPFASLQGIVAGEDSFTETGADGVDLHVRNDTTSSAYGVLGGEAAVLLPAGFAAPLKLTGRLGWAHEFGDTARTANAFFDGTPSEATFTVVGASVPRDAAVYGAGLTLATPSFNLFVRYDGATGDGSNVQGGSAGLRFTF